VNEHEQRPISDRACRDSTPFEATAGNAGRPPLPRVAWPPSRLASTLCTVTCALGGGAGIKRSWQQRPFCCGNQGRLLVIGRDSMTRGSKGVVDLADGPGGSGASSAGRKTRAGVRRRKKKGR